ncbi:hypothetical protein [Pseudonocardia sp. MH-G8]|uniref:hypothetical protein n=1 Tax=Pseudonocardia sp. MH-G8 TaxID=1854588 RepID=UPI000B9FD8A3|nr:hypothetical protein [Pseudonocardia sp. MH-G8]OZM81720.1 hypothetical protein CFP66_12215 [Pseudonocardia sp. MH-G8]
MAELAAVHSELDRIADAFPVNRDEFMPTRLGNILRRYEWTVGSAYNIDPIVSVPYLISVSDPADVEYMEDQRSQLDLAVRMTVVSLLATALTVVFLARHGSWLLVALVPYAAAYLAYRGSVVAAAEYGRALSVLITLNRFALYERLRLQMPATTDAERAQNADLMHFLRDGRTDGLSLTYQPPSA